MRYLLLGMMMALLTGCSGLFTSKDAIENLYVLNPIGDIEVITRPSVMHLNVQVPKLPEWLDSQYIILRRDENEVDFYAHARWASTTSELLGIAITESLMANGVVSDVFYNDIETQNDYLLITEVMALQADYEETENEETPPVIKVRMHMKLVSPEGKVLTQFMIESQKRAPNNRLSSIMKTFDASVQSCLKEMIYEMRGI